MYSKKIQAKLGPSRHLTFIFTAFVLMQIFNMLCARKIHDEWNIFEGIQKNIIFIVLWIVICAGQAIITTFGSYIFVCCFEGLNWQQWLIAIGVGMSSFIVNIILKLVPDWFCPKLGQDSVDDDRKEAAKKKREGTA